MSFQVCTIITRSYLPQARVLSHSFRQFHPETKFSALVFDASAGELDEPFNVFTLGDIGLPAGEERRMPMLYNVTELATALKPWFFRQLLSREPISLLYFDPDIEIFSPVDRLARLANEYCLVLTPHTTSPMSRDDVRPNETDILSAGAYNLGFLGLNVDCGRFLDWWSERLLREAVIDVANMRFTDQRWMDFAPGYFNSYIVKDETCNVAYWNADSRPLTWTGQRYEVNGQPLCFFHFSGFRPEVPHLLSSHQSTNPRTRLSEHPALARLCGEYAEKLRTAGYDKLQQVPYRWETAPNGLTITPPMQLAYRIALRNHEQTGAAAPPSAFVEPAGFVEWLNQPLYPRRHPEITRYFGAIHAGRPDVRAIYPEVPGADTRWYYEWLRDHGRQQIPIPDELFPPFPSNALRVAPPNRETHPSRGITLTGYLRAEAGTGEAARLMTMALEATGERQTTQVWTEAPSRQNHPWNNGTCALEHHYDTNLICINADQLPIFANEVGPEFFRHRYNIGLWFWEAEAFPLMMHRAFNYLHEVWVASEFVQNAISQHSPIPVFTIPLPLNIGARSAAPDARAAVKLPDQFLFLFLFDFLSVVERKNPVGLIEAFKRAFSPNEGPVLLIKSINGNRNLAELERLFYARDERTDIIIQDGYLTAGERDELIAACDCYISLHRSEGFGLTLAEAMLGERPTIGTRYSGNLEFMNDSNSFLCGYTLRRIGDGCSPYPPTARWADPNLDEAAELMRWVYRNPEEARRRASQGRRDLCANHHPQIAAEFIKSRLSQLWRKPPLPVSFTSARENVAVTRLRNAVMRGIDVRRTVPSLLTWLFQGPRRAMKRLLRDYDQHHRRLGMSTVDALQDLDAERLHDQDALAKRIGEQEDELQIVRRELKEARRRLTTLENELRLARDPTDDQVTESEQTGDHRAIQRRSGLG